MPKSPAVFLGGNWRAQIQITQRVIQRNEKKQQQNRRHEPDEGFPPPGILEPFGLKGDNFLVGIAKIRRINGFVDTLKAGVEDVQAPWHGCYINEINPMGSMVKSLIRHASPADFQTLLEIDEASFAHGVAYNAAELNYFMNRAGAETLVAEEDGQIVAFIIIEIENGRRRATVVTLDVRASHRRSGYGTQLLNRAQDILTEYGVETYDLQVDTTNRGAIDFYKKHGFKTIRTLKNYYANGHDAFLMMKEL
ncbi:MAG TPA: N-acetyltransferase [Terriglobia bacterium]|nr:N-acetyltransferase [Terriglobia bacterium]